MTSSRHPQDAQDVLRDLLSDPATLDRMAQELLAKRNEAQAARDAFVATPTFQGMVAMLLAAPAGTGFDNEELAYFPEQVVTRVWQGRFSAEDSRQLLDVLGNPRASEVPETAKTSDPACMFFNERYTFHGVVVSILSGQGTIVAVSNG